MKKLRFALTMATVFLTTHFAFARPLSEVYGQGQKEYHRLVYNRIYNWFQKNYFDFEKNMSSTEKEYIHHCLNSVESFGDSRFADIPLNYLHLGVQSGAQSVYSLAVACPERDQEGQKKLGIILKQKKLKDLQPENIFWLEWTSNKKEPVVYSFSSHELHRNDGILWKSLSSEEIKNLKLPPFLRKRLETAILVKGTHQESYILSLKSMDTDSLAPGFKEIVPKYFHEFGLIPDQVLFEPDGVEWLYLL